MRRLLAACLVGIAIAGAAGAETRVPLDAAEIQLSFAPVVKRSAPAVVNIYATWVDNRRVSPFADDPFFSQFFGNMGNVRPRVQNSLGSGVIVRPEGVVVSNYHVVQEATDIRVVLADRREYAGTVLLADPEADVAVIRLDGAEGLPALDFAESEAVEVGDLVLAIGNPFGVGQTVSSGIVSATARTGAATRQGSGYFIQTDAPINPGNSGGALVDMRGRLVGLNTSILTRSGGSNGIGFAIPADLVARYVEQALDGREEITRPWAGIAVQEVDGGLAEALGQSVPRGVLVTELHPQSPFAGAGVQPGDVILSVNGLPVNAGDELEYRLMTHRLGEGVAVRLFRDGAAVEVEVQVAEPPGADGATAMRLEGRSPLSGLTVADISPRLIDQLDLPLSARGVLVVGASGPARRLGLASGDVIESLNGRTLDEAEDLAEVVRRGAPVRDLEIRRGARIHRLRFGG